MTKAQLLHLLVNLPDDTEIEIGDDIRTHEYPTGEPIRKVIIENSETTTIEPPKELTRKNKIKVFLIS